jgi:hypothetical protein
MTSAGIESEFPEIKRLQTSALDRMVTRSGSAQLSTCFDSPRFITKATKTYKKRLAVQSYFAIP